MLAVLLWSISTVVTPLLAQSVPLLIICRVVLGLGEGLGKIKIEIEQLETKYSLCTLRLEFNRVAPTGLPVIFHLFAHNVPVEERSRAFGYLVAAGSVGQVVASVVGSFIILLIHINICEKLYFTKSMYSSLFFSDMPVLVMADWVLFIWIYRHFMDSFMANAIPGNELSRRDTIICS